MPAQLFRAADAKVQLISIPQNLNATFFEKLQIFFSAATCFDVSGLQNADFGGDFVHFALLFMYLARLCFRARADGMF